MWKELEPPMIPSLETMGGYFAKRFTSMLFTKLIDHRRGWVEKWMNKLGIDAPQKAIEFGIRYIDYPLTRGVPDDKHVWNGFSGKACYTVLEDYWQTCSETMMTYILNRKEGKNGFGDCEDASIFIVGMLRILGVDAYEYFGAVYKDGRLLGGHGYLAAKFPEDGSWHLVEATLDTPPKYPFGYPTVDPDSNEWKVGDITYKADIRFNEMKYYEWIEGSMMYEKFNKYISLKKRHKENIIKYHAIRDAWKIPTKAHRKRGLLARIRWRR